jgi:hypothetical protein
MSAKERAKAIRKELDRVSRYRRDHGKVAVDLVREVKRAVGSLVEEIKEDLPEISLVEQSPDRHRLGYKNKEHLLVEYDTSEVTVQEWKPDRTGTRVMDTFHLDLNQDGAWVWQGKSKAAIVDLADHIVTNLLDRVEKDVKAATS